MEIHFSLQEKGGESERQVGLTRDGVTEVAVPNSYLENAGTSRDYSIYAFLYISDGKSGNTEYKITMYVQSRPEPKDPETPEDPKDDPFGKTIEAVNEAMKSAQASAEVAADSAKSASESATQAEKSAVESQESAKAAATSEKAAATSATAAAKSERQARESATIASSAADQAAKSATTAAESTTTAAQLAENATRSATNASGSAESASKSSETAKTPADAAGKSASVAQQAAGSASESASTASAAAQTATTAAGKAAESATSASQSAETAGQKAITAETAAGKAVESATAAEKSATAAGASATAAKESETAANASAVTATEQAEKIKASAEQIEKNKTDVTSLKEDISNKITKFYASNQGETHLADSDNGKIMDMMLYGKSEQKQYSGKNLINSDEYYSEYKQSDGTYKGMANDFNDISVPISKYIETQITVSCKVIVPPDTSMVLIEATINGTVTKGNGIKSSKSGVAAITITPKTESDTIRITYGAGGRGIIVVSEFQIEKGSEATSYEPYVGGQPSPSPDYPQEIKSVVNPTVKVTNEDGTESQTVPIPYTFNAIPASSGGNVTIGKQQYISDYLDIEKGKLYRKVKRLNLKDVEVRIITHGFHSNGNGYLSVSIKNADKEQLPISNRYKGSVLTAKSGYVYVPNSNSIILVDDRFTDKQTAIKLLQDTYVFYTLSTPTEEDLSLEQIKSLKSLSTNYPVTNITVGSEQLDGYTVFNYPISMENGWNYVKKQLNDNRDYIYDMDLQSAEAYVNSEYAVTLTELEVM